MAMSVDPSGVGLQASSGAPPLRWSDVAGNMSQQPSQLAQVQSSQLAQVQPSQLAQAQASDCLRFNTWQQAALKKEAGADLVLVPKLPARIQVAIPFAFTRGAEVWNDVQSTFNGEVGHVRAAMMRSEKIFIVSDFPRKPIFVFQNICTDILKGDVAKRVRKIDAPRVTYQHAEKLVEIQEMLSVFDATITHVVAFKDSNSVKHANPDVNKRIQDALEQARKRQTRYPISKVYVDLPVETLILSGGTISPIKYWTDYAPHRATVVIPKEEDPIGAATKLMSLRCVKAVHRSGGGVRVLLTAPPTAEEVNSLKALVSAVNVYLDDRPIRPRKEEGDGASSEATSDRSPPPLLYAVQTRNDTQLDPKITAAIAKVFGLDATTSKANSTTYFVLKQTPKMTLALPPGEVMHLSSKLMLVALPTRGPLANAAASALVAPQAREPPLHA